MIYILDGAEIKDEGRHNHVKLIITKGTFKLNGGLQIDVPVAAINENSDIFIALNKFDGTPGFPPVIVRKEAHGFVVAGSGSDFSVYNYTVFTYKSMIEKE
jgi:hypothetical protein